MTQPPNDPEQDAALVGVTTLIVTFSEYVDPENNEFFVITVNPTRRIRIDSAIGILHMGVGVLDKFNDAYLDPDADNPRLDDPRGGGQDP
jgi:hypothetical protein